MAHPLKHAESSARRFGGKAEDYLGMHNWLALIWTVDQLQTIAKMAGSSR